MAPPLLPWPGRRSGGCTVDRLNARRRARHHNGRRAPEGFVERAQEASQIELVQVVLVVTGREKAAPARTRPTRPHPLGWDEFQDEFAHDEKSKHARTSSRTSSTRINIGQKSTSPNAGAPVAQKAGPRRVHTSGLTSWEVCSQARPSCSIVSTSSMALRHSS